MSRIKLKSKIFAARRKHYNVQHPALYDQDIVKTFSVVVVVTSNYLSSIT